MYNSSILSIDSIYDLIIGETKIDLSFSFDRLFTEDHGVFYFRID